MNEKPKDKICVVLTGGTICSVPDANGKNQSDAKITGTRLTEHYENVSASPFRKSVSFDIFPLKPDILSENMTANAWGDILQIFREQICCDRYKGIIVLHGTDTLAYTSAFLSFALAGIKIPVCMVSAQLRLGRVKENGEWEPEEKTNGYDNFRAAVELIMNGIAPNVYAVYRNEKNQQNGQHEPGELLVHYGSHLLQCPNASNNFHSRDEMQIPDPENASLRGRPFESGGCLYRQTATVSGGVLLLHPYTNLDYRRICLDGVKAVVHGTYHSESVCIGRPKDGYKREEKYYSLGEITETDQPYSILYLLQQCGNGGIPLFLAPCRRSEAAYGTTENAAEKGAVDAGRITLEAAYAKAVLGCSLGYEGDTLIRFMADSLNGEFETV